MRTEENDVPQYPKGDLRRMLSVLAAIDTMSDATLVKVVARTGIDKKTVTMLVQQATEQAGVSIEKDGSVYRLLDWGPVIKKAGAKMALNGVFNAPSIGAYEAHIGSRNMEEIKITEEAPDVVRISTQKLKVGHALVFKNPNGSWSQERVREIYKVTKGPPATITVGLGPIGHASRTLFLDEKVDVARASLIR
ncbi:hypothetical protein ACI2TD_18095 [Ralstonia nicotianae]